MEELPAAVRRILEAYLANRTGKNETFADFVSRVTPEGVKALLPKNAGRSAA